MRSHLPILTYHAIGDCPKTSEPHNCACISPRTFEQHMRFLSRWRQVIPLDDAVNGRIPAGRPAVAITFDDGYESLLTLAAPVLERFGFPATVFVPTMWIGKENGWDAKDGCYPLELMDEDDLVEAETRGISVESHGHAHMDLPTASPSEIADDLQVSFIRLTEVLGRQPRHLAYPYGRHSPQVRTAAEHAGFSHAFTVDETGHDRFGYERVSMDGREGAIRLHMKTVQGYLARRRSRLGMIAAKTIRKAAPRPFS